METNRPTTVFVQPVDHSTPIPQQKKLKRRKEDGPEPSPTADKSFNLDRDDTQTKTANSTAVIIMCS